MAVLTEHHLERHGRAYDLRDEMDTAALIRRVARERITDGRMLDVLVNILERHQAARRAL